jgi:hypothetical protein
MTMATQGTLHIQHTPCAAPTNKMHMHDRASSQLQKNLAMRYLKKRQANVLCL